MALSDLAVFSEYVYSAMTEVSRQQINLFNAASRNAIALRSVSHQGDYSDLAFWKKVSGLVRRRNAYGAGAVAEKVMEHLVDTMVKVAAGTPPVRIDKGQMKWILRSPEEQGAALGQQLAVDLVADMLNTGLMAGYAALSQVSDVILDVTGENPDTFSPAHTNRGAGKFGDRASEIAVWILHSKPMQDFYGTAIANASNLFTYGSINVISDPFGRIFVITDSPALLLAGNPSVYHILGLVPGAILVDQNDDFDANEETKNGYENIIRTYQAEWSYNLGVKGFAWDKTNGGKSPNDAALATATNWDKYATSVKDLAGVIIEVN